MGADVEGWVFEYLLLKDLPLFLLSHLPLQEVEGRTGLLHPDGLALPLLLLEYRTEVAVFPVVLGPLHLPYLLLISSNN